MPPPLAAQIDWDQVTNPFAFYGISALFVAYLVYMMVRRRKGERPGSEEREAEL